MKKDLNPRNIYLSRWILVCGIILIIVSIISLVLFFLEGETAIDNGSEDIVKSESLSCINEGTSYPFFTYDETVQKNAKVNAIFQGDKLDSLSLIYVLSYDDTKKVNSSININQTTMNKLFVEDGLAFDSLGLYFSKTSNNGVQFGLFTRADEINDISAKYFLLDTDEKRLAREELMQNYISKGFNCVIIN